MSIKTESILAIVLALAAGSAFAATPKYPDMARKPPLTQAGYESAREKIAAQYDADSKYCDGLKVKAALKDVCRAEARGKADSAKAELAAQYRPSPEATQKAKNVIADANYEVAKTRCGAMTGREKSRCVKEAKAAREAAIRQAKVEKVQETGGPFNTGKTVTQPRASAS